MRLLRQPRAFHLSLARCTTFREAQTGPEAGRQVLRKFKALQAQFPLQTVGLVVQNMQENDCMQVHPGIHMNGRNAWKGSSEVSCVVHMSVSNANISDAGNRCTMDCSWQARL